MRGLPPSRHRPRIPAGAATEARRVDSLRPPALNFNCTRSKRTLGDLPLESDGSACFQVPADKFVVFQALDTSAIDGNPYVCDTCQQWTHS